MTKLGSLSKAGKAAELTKRAGYFGGIGGVVDFAVSTPSELGTLSDITGLTEQTDFEGLEGRDRALETIKGKLKFGAEGAVIGGGITLLGPRSKHIIRFGSPEEHHGAHGHRRIPTSLAFRMRAVREEPRAEHRLQGARPPTLP